MSEDKREVVVTNVKIPFWSMVVLMVKWAIAAIPAVIGYNRFAARSEILMKRYETFSEEFTSILYRAVHSQR